MPRSSIKIAYEIRFIGLEMRNEQISSFYKMQVSLKVATALGPDSLYYNMVKKVEINISEAFIDTLMSTLH